MRKQAAQGRQLTLEKTTRADALEHKEEHNPAREAFVESLEAATLTTHFVSESAVTLFNQPPPELLPILPFGFQWINKSDESPFYSIAKHAEVPEQKLDLVLYGNEESNIDYSFLTNGTVASRK